MALPASGTISMNDIRVELGVGAQAPFSLDAARSGVYTPLNPYSPTLPPSSGTVSLASWYSYCHTCTTLYVFTVYRAANHPGLQNWTTAAGACSGTRDFGWNVVSSSSTLGAGSTLYHLVSGGYQPFYVQGGSGEEQWIWDGTGSKPIRMTNTSSNVIDAVGSCASGYEHWLAYDATGPWTVCLGGTYQYYSSASVLGPGERIYTNAALTTYAPAGYYSDGVTVWYSNNVGLLSYHGDCGNPY